MKQKEGRKRERKERKIGGDSYPLFLSFFLSFSLLSVSSISLHNTYVHIYICIYI